jgi:hypothetical protein
VSGNGSILSDSCATSSCAIVSPRNLRAVFGFPELPNDPPRWVVRPTDTGREVAMGKDDERDAFGLAITRRKASQTGLTLFNWQRETVLIGRQ